MQTNISGKHRREILSIRRACSLPTSTTESATTVTRDDVGNWLP